MGTTDCAPDPTSVATVQSWGAPARSDEFATTATEGWTAYVGTGYQGRGTRTPHALSVRDGVLTIAGDATGATGGMTWGTGQTYGRWEARVRVPAGDPAYDAVLLLWPDSDDARTGGEVDFMELQDPTRQSAIAAVHHGPTNAQEGGKVAVDATQWHNWAVEWTPTRVTTYLDAKKWFETTDPAAIPKGPMHLCLQLDYFGTGGTVKPSQMDVDWVRQYPLPAGTEGARAEGWPDPS